MEISAIQVARYILSFSWVYHGFFPKLFTIAPLERKMTATLGFAPELSDSITRLAGVSEIIFGVVLFFMYKNKNILYFNVAALIGLCLFVAVQVPAILIEAFNPLTTNLALVGLSYVLIKQPRI